MNRSILIVICDFLLVSLLVFSSPDINKVTNEGAERVVNLDVSTNQVDSRKDLAAVMRLALEEEQKRRDLLLSELTKTRQTSTEREKQLESFQQQLQTTEQQRVNLEQQFASAQASIQDLSQQVRVSSTDASTSKEKLAAMENELKKRAEQAAAVQQQLAQLATSNQAVLNEKQQLAGQLQVAEVEKRHAAEQAARMLEQVKVERDEKAMLVEGVKTLTSTTEQKQAKLQQQLSSAQTSIQDLSQQVRTSSTDATISKEKLAAMENELKKRAEEAAALQQQLAQLAKSNQVVLNEKQQLAGQLQVAEVEKRHATEQAARMQEQVKVEREEKAKLVEGVKTLASKSGELAQEIRENRPLAPNTIFNDLVTNRVQASLTASRTGLLGGSTKSKQMETMLVASGTNIFALCHVQDTPLTITDPGTDWEALTGTLARNDSYVPIRSLSFCWPDPRVLLIPVSSAEARKLGSKVYRISSDPYKFQDAILVGAREGYYGECKFEIDLSTPEYVKLDRNLLKGLVGKFNPSRGDFVFSKSGEFLGVMANSTYCMMFQKLDTSATLQLGPDVRDQHTGETLARLYSFLFRLASKLQ